MTRLQRILVVVVAGELVVGAVLFARQRSRPAPPVADLSIVDPLAAAQIRDLAQEWRSPEAWARLGEAYLAYGYFREAEACYRVAVEREPARADFAYGWAFALERIGQIPEANREYERAIRLRHPRADDCWYFIGRNWLREEKADEAREAFQKAGRQPSARYEIARLLVHASKVSEAIPLLDQLSAEYPKAIQPYLLRHRIEVLRDSPTAAVYADLAGRAPDVLPNPWDREYTRLEAVHERMGVAGEWKACEKLLASRKLDEVEPRLREALRLQWDPLGVDLLAKVELRRGRPEEAVRLLQEVNDRMGPSIHFLTRLGDEWENAGQPNRAAQAWTRAVQLGRAPNAKHLRYQHSKLAEYYEKSGAPDAAR